MNSFYKNLSMWLVIGLTMILLFNMFNKPQPSVVEMSYSDFLTSVESGQISSVNIQGDQVTGKSSGD
ncbi:MAG: ATP-dependent metallopeptidase FtsH/Yme1/Tma family protein, partial [Proteobacteria bacterium]|nr:ATP-dependent metallopeptidase FtsH/Yme1/Tma family protein [Pseudomonadota bacterium]